MVSSPWADAFFGRLDFLEPVPVEDLLARLACALGTLRFMGLSRFVCWGSEGISSATFFVRPDLWWDVPWVAFRLSAVTILAWIFVACLPLPLRLVSANLFIFAILFFVSSHGLILLSTCGSYLTRSFLHCFGQPRVLAIGHQNSSFLLQFVGQFSSGGFGCVSGLIFSEFWVFCRFRICTAG